MVNRQAAVYNGTPIFFYLNLLYLIKVPRIIRFTLVALSEVY